MTTKLNYITREELEVTVIETEVLIHNLIMKKYVEGDEKTLADVIERIISIVEEKYNRIAYSPEQIEEIKIMLREGYFIPGGSILAGLSKSTKKKSSLSNCYVLKIKNDSIESIFAVLGEMAKTYSYRGGCGADITVLRPHGVTVNNAAKTSSGAVSFMPMIANVTETIGQDEGRRGAMMITIDVKHPDLMRFIWSKADPERVFYTDNMNKTLTSKKIINFLNTCPDKSLIPSSILTELKNMISVGKTATIDSANISIRYSDEFMKAVNRDLPWDCYFPDIQADKKKYDEEWDGDYDKWVASGGKLKKYDTYQAAVTQDNYRRFIGHQVVLGYELTSYNTHLPEDEIPGVFGKINYRTDTCTEENLLDHLKRNGSVELTFKIPTARQIFHDACLAAWLRGDPGALFWDTVSNWSTIATLHELLKFISTNPCSEIPSYAGGSCLLGAHVLSKYVTHPWQESACWNDDIWWTYSSAATRLMNIFSDINEEMHPLDEQIQMEKFAKRIGIEFTGLGDALAMLNLQYGDHKETIQFIRRIMCQKSYLEITTSLEIAEKIGCCQVFISETNPGVRKRFIDTPYFNNICIESLELIGALDLDDLRTRILTTGLRNVAFNTVGPTGSLSILMDNCSSGIEPIFAMLYNRTTRIGNQQIYHICHTPLARHLLNISDQTEWEINALKEQFNIVEAHELGYKDRIAVQVAVQEFCDSSISSTLNLPKDCTVEDIVEIYQYAWTKELKGVTIFRDGSLDGVLNAKSQTDKPTDTSVVSVMSTPTDFSRGILVDPSSDSNSRSHRITWNGYNMYITITLDKQQQPLELFISNLPREVSVKNDVFDPIDYQEKMSLWMAVTRLVSIGLRGGIPVEHFVKQLNKASFIINDLMSIVARILSQYVGDPTIKEQAKEMSIENLIVADFTTICPKCGKKTYIAQSGCGQCMNPECCYTKC